MRAAVHFYSAQHFKEHAQKFLFEKHFRHLIAHGAGEKNKQKYRIVVHRSVIAYDYRGSLYPAILHAFVLVQNFGVETRFLHGIGGYFGKSVEKSYH